MGSASQTSIVRNTEANHRRFENPLRVRINGSWYKAAKRLLEAGVGRDSQRFFVLIGLYMTPYMAARLEPALELAREFVEAAERQDEAYYRLAGYRMVAMMQIAMGQNREALKNLQRALRLRDPKQTSSGSPTDAGCDSLYGEER